MENQLNAGATSFVYHAVDMPCQVFTASDMTLIIRAFRRHTLYHTTYFNAAKQYIKTLTNIDEVTAFTYGTDISDTVEDIMLRQILKKGDGRI
jgi:hypothetical protein